MSLKSLFKRKEGGTIAGNILRGVAKIAKPIAGGALNALAPGSGTLLNFVPIGEGIMKLKEPEVQEKVAETIAKAAVMPPQSPEESKALAKNLKNDLISMGVDTLNADKLGSYAYDAAAASPVTTNQSLVKDDVRRIFNGAVTGAKTGAIDAYLNKTKHGQEVVKEAATSQFNKYLPFILGGVIVVLIFKLFTKK